MFTDRSTPFRIHATRFKDGSLLFCLMNEQTYETVHSTKPTTGFLPPQWMVDLRDQLNAEEIQEPDRSYEAKSRLCLKCRKRFMSSWPGERVCPSCKSQLNWREGTIPLNEYK